MSRSIHDTWGVLRQIRREDYADPDEKRDRLRVLRANIQEQHAVKQQTRHQRRRGDLSAAPVDANRVPIHVSDEGEFVHHSATEEDVRAVLRRLPLGVLDGLSSIHLCRCPQPKRRAGDEPKLDPYTGSPGREILPSVYMGWCHGDCSFGGGRVRVFAHLHPPAATGVHAIYLKLWALATLVHECSHHFDDTFRGDGDRWHKWDKGKTESYVRARSLQLVETCVVPFLEERYPSECQALAEWMERHGGVVLPLALLTDDRNENRGLADFAYRQLVGRVAEGGEPAEIRREFAGVLSLGGHHREAIQILERALADRPGDTETMLDLAFSRLLAGQTEQADILCARLVELVPEDARAWTLLAWAHRGASRWEEQARCAGRALALLGKDGHDPTRPLHHRADAWICLERWDDLSADIAALMAVGSRYAREQAEVLTLRMKCLTGRWREALVGAIRMLRGGNLGFTNLPFVKAVRFECAHRLGRRSAAGRLSEHEVETLRSYGQGAWVERLATDFDLRPAKKLRYDGV